MPRIVPLLLVGLCLGLAVPVPAAPPGPTDLARSIETSKKTIGDFEKIIRDYDDETRRLVGHDTTSAKRREEIRIIKRYYAQEIEALRAKVIEDYKKIQEYRAGGVQ